MKGLNGEDIARPITLGADKMLFPDSFVILSAQRSSVPVKSMEASGTPWDLPGQESGNHVLVPVKGHGLGLFHYGL